MLEHKRLWVGYRRIDFTGVWYEPDGNPSNEDKPPGLLLFSKTRGKAKAAEPYYGEVVWDPLFDPETAGSKSVAERKELRARFLRDTYLYMTCKNSAEVKVMETRFAASDPKRQALLRVAKPIKRMRTDAAERRKTRRADAIARGEPVDSIEGSDTESEHEGDSAYGSRAGTTPRFVGLDGSIPPPPSGRSSQFGARQRAPVPLFNESHRGNTRIGSTGSADFESMPVGDEPTPEDLASGLFPGFGVAMGSH